jgi:hypothetical protein
MFASINRVSNRVTPKLPEKMKEVKRGSSKASVSGIKVFDGVDLNSTFNRCGL